MPEERTLKKSLLAEPVSRGQWNPSPRRASTHGHIMWTLSNVTPSHTGLLGRTGRFYFYFTFVRSSHRNADLCFSLRDFTNPQTQQARESTSHPLFFLLLPVSSLHVFHQASPQLNPVMWNSKTKEGWVLSGFMAAWPFSRHDSKQCYLLLPKGSLGIMVLCSKSKFYVVWHVM